MAVFSRLLPALASAYGLQTIFALVFVPLQNEKYYDLCGALGFLSTTFVSLYYPSLKAKFIDGAPGSLPSLVNFAPRQLLLSAALGIWTARLGTFLALRAIRAGGDSRFDQVKTQPANFTGFWLAQATWISLVGLPVYLCNTLQPAHLHPSLNVRDYASIALFAGSLLFEVVADRQKSAWRRAKERKEHDERFITSGLWSISRHPNYVGEVGIWTGIWALSTTSLQTSAFPRGAVAFAALSPLFTWFLIRNVSGVPPLERSADEKYGDDPEWVHYKRTVPVFWPWGSAN